MSRLNVIERWEFGLGQDQPTQIATLLPVDEKLLWAARLKSSATAKWHYRGAVLAIIAAGFFLAIAPWGESLDEYCGPNPGRCLVLFYATWPTVLFQAGTASVLFWSGWKAEHRPWIIGYAISTKRALLIDESRPKDFRYIYLHLHPPKLEPSGILGFEGETHGFVGLDRQSAARALYWATDGQLAVSKDQSGSTP
jgi:hypothetical protein